MSDPESADEFRLAPPDCPSRDDWQRHLSPPITVEEPPPPPSDWPRFTISDLLIVTIGAAIGMAGGTWMPPDEFAAILGLVTLLALLLVHLWPPETRLGKVLWAALVVAYIMAVLAALAKSAMR